MPTVAQKLMTAEEFLRMPPPLDGAKLELIEGEVVSVCRPGFRHGARQGRAYAILDHYGRTTGHGRAVVETGVFTERDPDTVRGPDVSYWSAARLPLDQEPEGYPELAPELCVEVLSPSNRPEQIQRKMQEYFGRDVRMVWIIDPDERTLTVHRPADPGMTLHEADSFTAEDILPGFSLCVAELFA